MSAWPLDIRKVNTMIDVIVSCTNEEGPRVMGDDWIMTTSAEIETSQGLLLLASVYRSRLEPLIHLWSVEQGRPIFGSADRSQIIMRFMRFDSKATNWNASCRQRYKMASIRNIHD